MKTTSVSTFFVIAAALFNGVSASALRARQIPNCAATCLASADLGDCQPTDNACLCNNQAFVSSTATCIAESCQGDELEQANAASRSLCAAVGVTLTSSVAVPTSTSPTSSSADSETSPSAAPDSNSSSNTTSSDNNNNGAISHGVNALASIVVIGVAAAML
ncbi:hypothetical protein VKT23_016338 [Stygiomarasmius scandens]|uniref:CFEM domain-containing protein n=1 Tax=Marasmiellus scandens TaxID=2682957 RepID=A0ABR1IXJ7_9AGAR